MYVAEYESRQPTPNNCPFTPLQIPHPSRVSLGQLGLLARELGLLIGELGLLVGPMRLLERDHGRRDRAAQHQQSGPDQHRVAAQVLAQAIAPGRVAGAALQSSAARSSAEVSTIVTFASVPPEANDTAPTKLLPAESSVTERPPAAVNVDAPPTDTFPESVMSPPAVAVTDRFPLTVEAPRSIAFASTSTTLLPVVTDTAPTKLLPASSSVMLFVAPAASVVVPPTDSVPESVSAPPAVAAGA